eukprot:TRINITY_DN42_c0_g1_i9.p1 TRINITY_DN42_c0_g1~~TRINITY_DN42_c0_g1_i9.p1  ORF type:complete len:989 (-),score=203.65 TRINITY_DN42_c0_g1_i9:259-3225(-)
MSSCTAFVSTMDKRKRSRANAQGGEKLKHGERPYKATTKGGKRRRLLKKTPAKEAGSSKDKVPAETKQVRELLRNIGFEQYAEAFESDGFDDIDTLSKMEEKHMVALGILKTGHRLKLKSKIDELQAEGKPGKKEVSEEGKQQPVPEKVVKRRKKKVRKRKHEDAVAEDQDVGGSEKAASEKKGESAEDDVPQNMEADERPGLQQKSEQPNTEQTGSSQIEVDVSTNKTQDSEGLAGSHSSSSSSSSSSECPEESTERATVTAEVGYGRVQVATEPIMTEQAHDNVMETATEVSMSSASGLNTDEAQKVMIAQKEKDAKSVKSEQKETAVKQHALTCLDCTMKQTAHQDFFGDKAELPKKRSSKCTSCGREPSLLFRDAGPHRPKELKDLGQLLKVLDTDCEEFAKERNLLRREVAMKRSGVETESDKIKLMLLIAGHLSADRAEVEGVSLHPNCLENAVFLLRPKHNDDSLKPPKFLVEMCIEMRAFSAETLRNVQRIFKPVQKHFMLSQCPTKEAVREDFRNKLLMLHDIIEPCCELMHERGKMLMEAFERGHAPSDKFEQLCGRINIECKAVKFKLMRWQTALTVSDLSDEKGVFCLSTKDMFLTYLFRQNALRMFGTSLLESESSLFEPMRAAYLKEEFKAEETVIDRIFKHWKDFTSLRTRSLPVASSQGCEVWLGLEQRELLLKDARPSIGAPAFEDDACSCCSDLSKSPAPDVESDEDSAVPEEHIDQMRARFVSKGMKELVAFGGEVLSPYDDLDTDKLVHQPSSGDIQQEPLFTVIDFEVCDRKEMYTKWKSMEEDLRTPLSALQKLLDPDNTVVFAQLVQNCKLLMAALARFMALLQITPPHLKLDRALSKQLKLPDETSVADYVWNHLLSKTWSAFRKESKAVAKSCKAALEASIRKEKWGLRCKNAVHHIFSDLSVFVEPVKGNVLDKLISFLKDEVDLDHSPELLLRETWEAEYDYKKHLPDPGQDPSSNSKHKQ